MCIDVPVFKLQFIKNKGLFTEFTAAVLDILHKKWYTERGYGNNDFTVVGTHGKKASIRRTNYERLCDLFGFRM